MSSYHDSFGSSALPDADIDGQDADAQEAADEEAAHLERYALIDTGSSDDCDLTIWTCDGCGAEGTEGVMERHECSEGSVR